MAKIKDELEEIKYLAHKELCERENDPTCVWCKDIVKNENYYINKCSGLNKIKRTDTDNYGNFSTFHKVEDKIVELQQRVVANGEDDIDYELDNVIVHERSLLDNLKDAVDLNPMELLGK